MNILILGAGGRELSIYDKLQESDQIKNLYLSSIDMPSLDILNFEKLENIIIQNKIDILIVGPEVPLARGIKNYFQKQLPQLYIFGPDKQATRLEASKRFAVEYMQSQNIKTAQTKFASSFEEADSIIKTMSLPFVIKVDGLAAGKGVSIHKDIQDAQKKLKDIFHANLFQDAGKQVLIQSFMNGTEASLFALCNGQEAIYLPVAKDYKPVFDNNKGANTGGMGSYCPNDLLTIEQKEHIHKKIVIPILRDFHYSGILYIGLMLHSTKDDDISVVEFNCRFGDPETQVILPMIKADLLPYILWGCQVPNVLVDKVKNKSIYEVPQRAGAMVNVVIAAQGYPQSYEKNIYLELPTPKDSQLKFLPAGATKQGSGYVSTGGRVLNIISHADSMIQAREKIYSYIQEIKKINDHCHKKFHFRTDIAVL